MADNVPNITLNNGVEIPAIGLGVFQTPADETRDAATTALKTGYLPSDFDKTLGAYRPLLPASEVQH